MNERILADLGAIETQRALPPMPALISVVVLAGGASRRMGSPKPLLPFSPDETFLDHILSAYAELPAQAIVVLPGLDSATFLRQYPTGAANAKFVFNHEPDADRIASLMHGLAEAPTGSYVFVQDVDRPFIEETTLRELLQRRCPRGWTAPLIDGHAGHPVLLSPHVARMLKQGPKAATLREALEPFERTLVPVTHTACERNINTPDDVVRYVHSEHTN